MQIDHELVSLDVTDLPVKTLSGTEPFGALGKNRLKHSIIGAGLRRPLPKRCQSLGVFVALFGRPSRIDRALALSLLAIIVDVFFILWSAERFSLAWYASRFLYTAGSTFVLYRAVRELIAANRRRGSVAFGKNTHIAKAPCFPTVTTGVRPGANGTINTQSVAISAMIASVTVIGTKNAIDGSEAPAKNKVTAARAKMSSELRMGRTDVNRRLGARATTARASRNVTPEVSRNVRPRLSIDRRRPAYFVRTRMTKLNVPLS